MRVAAHVPDLMDRSRLRSTKTEVVLVADPAELVGLEVDLVVVDLSLIHISEPTRPEPISYAVFCLKKKT